MRKSSWHLRFSLSRLCIVSVMEEIRRFNSWNVSSPSTKCVPIVPASFYSEDITRFLRRAPSLQDKVVPSLIHVTWNLLFFFARFNRSKRSLLPNVRNDDVKVFDEYLKEERETRWEQAVESSFVEMFISDTSFHTRAYYLQSQGGTISSRSSGEINKRRSNRYFTSIFRTERIETKHRRHTVDSEISRPELERGRCERDPLHYRPRIS